MNIQKIDWQKVVGRKTDLQKAIQFSCRGKGGFGAFFKVDDLEHQLFYFDGRITSGYFSEKEYALFKSRVFRKLHDVKLISRLESEILVTCEDCLKEAVRLLKNIAKKNNASELEEKLRKFDEIWNKFYPIAWSFFFIEGFEQKLNQKLEDLGFDSVKAEEIVTIAARPGRITPVIEAEIGVLKLAEKIKSGEKDFQEFAQELSREFGWMSYYNTGDKIRNWNYYFNDAKKIIKSGIDISGKIKAIIADIKRNENSFISHLYNIPDKLLKKQLKFLHISGYLRDKREEIRDRLTMLEESLYKAIAKKTGLTWREIVHLSSLEISSILLDKSKKQKLAKIAEKRMKNFVFTVDHGKLTIMDDPKRIKEVKKLLSVEKNISHIVGQVAYRQLKKTKGFARIVFGSNELKKIQKGDIFVTTMTKPDFVPAMKKSRAIITDEGGLTCHAAIIARELKIPCIVGTKIATKVLKDGDLVEVDADKGVVKIII